MEAAPINPSDLGVMFARADMRTVVRCEHCARGATTLVKALTGRIGLTFGWNKGVVWQGRLTPLLWPSSACGAPCMRSLHCHPAVVLRTDLH
jgi:hypothetical protein